MADALIITSLITAIGSLVISILTHIKHSKCLGVDITTTESHTPTIPEINYGNMIEAITQQPRPLIISDPIPIPASPKPKKNYL